MLGEFIEKIISYFKIDFWVIWGLAAQGFFFFRMIIQWLQSEKERKTVVPLSFWWLGIMGAIMLFVYAMIRRDIVFILTSILQLVIYSRNLAIAIKEKEINTP
ncbi:MAG: hypothetical protein HN390_08165 [Anaerolineae bacterium]|jgi:lipid-A-disaccharide synthase-like uncharacterized protein|nr:hypothetical protein [Anaerolineae bacterium]MBT7192035.1 hypothetical protein [Anaerolineae bacterium]MBT7988853.1 hypothetical protein [Anaerolineae bacterium]